MRYLFLLLSVVTCFTSCAQADEPAIALSDPVTETFLFPLGNRQITIRKSTFDTAGKFVFVQLHHNEETAEKTATEFLQQHGGVVISLENSSERNVRFKLKGRWYTFDPNRMFTRSGIIASLKQHSTYTARCGTRH